MAKMVKPPTVVVTAHYPRICSKYSCTVDRHSIGGQSARSGVDGEDPSHSCSKQQYVKVGLVFNRAFVIILWSDLTQPWARDRQLTDLTNQQPWSIAVYQSETTGMLMSAHPT
jgi:hypothetical protein